MSQSCEMSRFPHRAITQGANPRRDPVGEAALQTGIDLAIDCRFSATRDRATII